MEVRLCTLYVEVRKFRMGEKPSNHPVQKIVDAVRQKRRQLPRFEIGFVAVDNFDLRLEPRLRHDRIAEGLCEIERLARYNPKGWQRPSGVIVAAASTMGSGPVIHRPPHFVWINRSAECPPPDQLVEWLLSSLPSGRLFEATNERSTGGLGGMPEPMIT